jgi:hypothetical protein
MTRRLMTAFAVALVATACTDRDPVGPGEQLQSIETEPLFHHSPGHTQGGGQQAANGLLSDIPVVGEITDGVFEGVLNITSLAFVDGQLLASGTLTGTATQAGGTIVTEISQTFEDVAMSLTRTASGACRILLLELDGLFLDLLGLEVDLAPVELEIRAQPGSGNLLGNLLCAVVSLLDGPGALAGAFQAVFNLIDRINALL